MRQPCSDLKFLLGDVRSPTKMEIVGLRRRYGSPAGLNCFATGALLFATLVVGGCAGTTTASTRTPAEPDLTTTPSVVNFGTVVTGTSGSQSIRVTNSGTAGVTINGAVVSGTGFSMSGLTTPLTINSGGDVTFVAAFAPTAVGNASGSVSITSNAPGSPLNIALNGEGAAPTLQLTANPATVNFGDVAAGSSASQNVRLQNTGNSSVTISQVTVSGTGYSASGVTPGEILTTGQSTTLAVSFAPTTTGSFPGSITVASNATNSSTVSLSGGSHSVTISWTASTSKVVGYYLYRAGVSGGPYAKINSSPVAGTTFTDIGIASGQVYYYVVTSVDSIGVESSLSDQASATVPTP